MQYRKGLINSTTALIASGVQVPLGFIPDKFTITNFTKTVAGAGVGHSEWIHNVSANASALVTTYTAGAPVVTQITSNGITPVAIGGNWLNTIYTITGITNANPGVVTVASAQPANSMLLANGMTVTISGVVGMKGLNTNRFIIANVNTGAGTFQLFDTFGNPVDTTALGTYASGGQIDVISYPPTAPVLNPVNGQVVVPGSPAGLQYDTGYQGVSLGSGVLGSNGDVLFWEAFYETPTGY